MDEKSTHRNLSGGRPKRRRWRLALLLVVLILLIYVTSYALLSVFGKYVTVASGRTRMPYGLAIPDTRVWQPYGGSGYMFLGVDRKTSWQADSVGLIYCPLMMLDQRFWHPNIRNVPSGP